MFEFETSNDVSYRCSSSALLSDAQSTIETLIQRPSSITTTNAFDEFSILDKLIDVSNDVDRFENVENRKFLNIAQLITASTCIYSRRVDALYKLINNFQENNVKKEEEIDRESNCSEPEEKISLRKTKNCESKRSLICRDLNKINLNESKPFFVDRTSLIDLNVFRNFFPMGNKQFWTNDERPRFFDFFFETTGETNEQKLEEKAEEPAEIEDFRHVDSTENPIEYFVNVEKPRFTERRNKRKRETTKKTVDSNIFRQSLTEEQGKLFQSIQLKSNLKKKLPEQVSFFAKEFNSKRFDEFICFYLSKQVPPTVRSLFIFPEKIRFETTKIFNEPIFEQNFEQNFEPTDTFETSFDNDLKTILDTAIDHIDEGQKPKEFSSKFKSNILEFIDKNGPNKLDDLIDSLYDQYSLSMIFWQILHFCASTQQYYLRSTDENQLFLENAF